MFSWQPESQENFLHLRGPNIAFEIYNKEYANACICGSEKWRLPLAKFLRQPHFIVWDNSDLVTHEVMGDLKNVYAIGAEPEKLAGPLLADTYVTLLKRRNAWYGQMIAKGQLSLDIGDTLVEKELFREQGVQAIPQALRDENMNDPRDRIEIAQSHAIYRPSLIGFLITSPEG
ncbi:hypothetical protein BUALT_Bualt12G0020500 [Buddleja alternifolia]|uniref:Uncharacterized protein n=1 Tax=Buddleja alternifolia TaxID=168488 RepID=A0AAV6WYM3_9LAMI|nr:hypothetical protein BUALT_Bualt12G0020500 [Buddleja alternifolia]